MITPPPVPLEHEHGRLWVIEMGRNEKKLLPEHQEEHDAMKEEGKEIPDEFFEERWVAHPFDQQ